MKHSRLLKPIKLLLNLNFKFRLFFLETCKKEKVRVIFVQPEFDRRNAEIIAKQTGTKVVPINPLSYDWEEEMLNIARELVVKK